MSNERHKAMALSISRKATQLQVAIVGQTNLSVTDVPLDAVQLAMEISVESETLGREIEASRE